MKRNVIFFCDPGDLRGIVLQKLTGMREFAARAGWSVALCHAVTGAKSLRHYISAYRAAGCIVGTVEGIPKRVFSGIERMIPLVFMDQPPGYGRLCVNSGSGAIAETAAAHLVRQGYESFAFAGAPGNPHWSEGRREAFARAILRDKGVAVRELPGREAGCDPYGATKSRMAFLSSLPPGTAVFAANDMTAVAIMEAARFAGLKIPSDVAVIGVDDDSMLCETSSPPLTSVRVDFRRMGYLAAALLDGEMRRARRDMKARRTVLCDAMAAIPRESTARLRISPNAVARKAYAYIHAADLAMLTARDAAAVSGASRRTVETRFRQVYGRSLLDEIEERKVRHAARLLGQTSFTAAEIAAACGYRTPAFLQRLFRRKTGTTMESYRRKSVNP